MRAVPRRLLLAGAIASCVGAAAAIPALASADSKPKPVQVTAAEGTPIAGQYIVTLKDGSSPTAAAGQVGATSVQDFGDVLNGFVARLNPGQLDKLRKDKRVAAIEQDQLVHATTTQKSPLPWGLDRIDQRRLPLSKSYSYKATGKGVTAYVIDSGIAWSHPQFGGRAKVVWTAPRFKSNGWDYNGHGTHVAGIVGSAKYGAAKSVQLRALRVLDENGSAPVSDVVAAVKWLRGHAARPAVANLSIGGGKSAALDTAVANLSKSRVFVTVAAGNDNKDACRFSPSGAPWVEAVGATTSHDNRADFSNYGKCVDILAPGYGITSTWPGGGTEVESGTSMASPYVAGVAALYLQSHPKADFPTVQKWLKDNATTNVLKNLKTGTPNRLLYKGGL
ncbi:S8 family peptidase [Actinomadura rupiterrae]|uniref:S8 family peptidase n=1 Tax=Actinomadura rupiterrae TaxID=559627 RepID=UPI0020A56470|nr:S8 family peptidase [Actinomadura rupiterrae]MCP2337695.1 subtilisin family serine protease [Actinomadura rupiterrae]